MPMVTTQWHNLNQKQEQKQKKQIPTKRIVSLESPNNHITQRKHNTHILYQKAMYNI